MTMSEASVLCVGEVVWDLFPDGLRLGGAPLNVSVHLARQGVNVALLTAVGKDERGQDALRFLEEEGISGARLHPDLPTGTVNVRLDAQGVPEFTIQEGCAWTDLENAEPLDGMLSSAFAPWPPMLLVFGGVCMHSAANRRLLEELFPLGLKRPERLCDLNLRPGWAEPGVLRWCLEQADYLKVNQEELDFLLAQECLAAEGDLLKRFRLKGLCVTRGPEGLRWRDDQGWECSLPVLDSVHPVVDTVGAGDAVTAAIALGLLRGESVTEFLEWGRRMAAQICAVRGALPPRGDVLPKL